VASVVSESLRPSPAVRGSTLASPRLMIFETDALVISISISEPSPTQVRQLVGSIAPKMAQSLHAGGRATVVSGLKRIHAEIDEHGEFEAAIIAPEDFRIEIELGSDRILVLPSQMNGEESEAQKE